MGVIIHPKGDLYGFTVEISHFCLFSLQASAGGGCRSSQHG